MAPSNLNTPVPDIPYFTPQHLHSPGTPKELTSTTPTLFTPLQIRNVTLRNRIIVSPMCQYSTAPSGPEIGALTDWHVATLGHYAIKGAALVFVEATSVQPNGRISPNCPGLWDDAQIEGLKRVANFVKSQGTLVGIQLAHAGRKSSTAAPWLSTMLGRKSKRAEKDIGGWPDEVKGPSGGDNQTWDGFFDSEQSRFWPPKALTTQEVKEIVQDFATAAERSVRAGVDVIEIHAAHGYLLHQFLSPISNRRTDEYGGSFENRTRLLFEVIEAIRNVIPTSTPLFLRISSTEFMEGTDLGKELGSWDVEDTIKVAIQLPALGVDLLDVSSGGNHPGQRIDGVNTKDYHVKIAGRIRNAVHANNLKLLIGAVGMITEAEQARDIVEQANTVTQSENGIHEEAKAAKEMTDTKDGKHPMADIVLVARQFLREPEWVLKVAWKLGVDVWWPSQFMRVATQL
ncbi:probable NADH:flavin oxidoreductase/12-oxophytodienoate reductase [Phialocephala subalpina]|uniref:Probable NADH:flavin oxidoreductase/12-oxophytodienoate reductase n=1 Tax=Phialocephala subalpina TaxID=576137 RepID=A0A1L7XP18_9HELO|nr:probable NADH:flavin oxidoreductase/12-oxophytodienoate reductase [Phialocephala subalpina]